MSHERRHPGQRTVGHLGGPTFFASFDCFISFLLLKGDGAKARSLTQQSLTGTACAAADEREW